MPTWGQLLERPKELHSEGRRDAFDIVRRQALADLHSYTGRNVILYAAGHLQKPGVPPELVSITDEDIEGFMEVVYGLSGSSLDLILQSPGGRAEATEAIVNYLRAKFSDIRIIVPHQAMSAGAMLACAGNTLVMGSQSYLGPIDPQFQLHTALGIQSVPAQAILDQFARAKREFSEDRANLSVWLPSLQQYGPALLEQCENAIALSKELVSKWLALWMLAGVLNGKDRAEEIAGALCDHQRLRTHGRPLNAQYLESVGMMVSRLEWDHQLQDKVLTVYHAAMHTFSATGATKIIENHLGRAFVKAVQRVVVRAQPEAPPPQGPQPEPAGQ